MTRKKTILALAGAMMFASAFADTQTVNGVTWTYTVKNGESWISGCAENPVGHLDIPAELGGRPVVSIGDYALSCFVDLTSVTIPPGVASIGEGAFVDCDELASVEIPSSVTNIGACAFGYCYALTSVTIPPGLTSIAYGAFEGCALKTVTIPPGVAHIGEWAFSSCDCLTSIKIPSSVTSVGTNALEGCEALSTVYVATGDVSRVKGLLSGTGLDVSAVEFVEGDIPDVKPDGTYTETVDGYTWKYRIADGGAELYSEKWYDTDVVPKPSGRVVVPDKLGGCPVVSVGQCALSDCPDMTELVLPATVKSIGFFALCDCSHLTDVELPEGLQSIGEGAFKGCTSLVELCIPAECSDISDEHGTCYAAFTGCSSLSALSVAEGNQWFAVQDGVLYDKDLKTLLFCPESMTKVEIPETVIRIYGTAFQNCKFLTELKLPNGLREIGRYAFNGTQLGEIVVPGSMKCIKSEALTGRFNRIVLEEGVEILDGMVFYDANNLTSVKLPTSLRSMSGSVFEFCSSLKRVVIPAGVTNVTGKTFVACSSLEAVIFFGDAPVVDGIYGGTSYWDPPSSNLVTYVLRDSKGWDGNPASMDIPDAWPVGEECTRPIVALDPSETHVVTFDLGEHGSRTGGGELVQSVGMGADAVAPEVTAAAGWEFVGWDKDISFVLGDMTVLALYNREGAEDGRIPVLEIDGSEIVGYSYVGGQDGCLTNGVLVIPDGITAIRAHAIEKMEGLGKVIVPSSVKSIGDFAFGGCPDLSAVTFGDFASCSVSETAFKDTPWDRIRAKTLSVGPGKVSTFTIKSGGVGSPKTIWRAVIAGISGVTWEDFLETPYRGNGYDEVDICACLTYPGIIDVEKTEAEDADDYACWQLPKINMAYWGGYVSKNDYPTEDDVADKYRESGCYDEAFAWLNVPTNRLVEVVRWGAAEINEFIVRHLKDGNALVELATSISSHGITCCGYVCDEGRELWEPGYLTGLFVIDSDNDMHVNGGARNAPNRITYCPVVWVDPEDGYPGYYQIGNVWGLEWDYFDPHFALWAKGAPVAEKISMPFGFEMRGTEVTGFHGDLPAKIVLPRGTTSVGASAFDADYHDVGSLVSVALPEGVTNIGVYAFWSCENLTTVGFPASLESVDMEAFAYCASLKTVYVAPGDTERIRDLLAASAGDPECGGLDVCKLAFVEGEHPDLTAARLEWAKADAIEAIESAAGDQSGWNAALAALVKDAVEAVCAATTLEAAESAGKAGVVRIEEFVNEVESEVTGLIDNFDLYEDVRIGFRRITAVGSEVWIEVSSNGTFAAELSVGDWQVTVEAWRKRDGEFYTATESLTVTDSAATFDLSLPADEHLGNAKVDLREAGQYADVGVGGLSAVARKSAEAEGKSVTYELKVADPELLIEREEKPVLRMMASARAVQASANVSAASIAAMRAAVDGLRQTAETVIADINRRVNILSIALSRSDDGGRTWSDVEALEDETVEVTVPLEIDSESDFAILRSDGNEVESVLRNVDNGLNAPKTGSDESFRVEEGKVVMKISRFAVFAVVSGSPRERLYPDGDGAYAVPTASVSYEGVLLRDGAVAGTVSASVSKPNVRKGSEANITLKVKTIEKASYAFAAKKVPLPGSEGRFVLDPSNKKSASLGAATVVFGGDSLTGSFANGLEIDAVRDVFKEKGNVKRDRISRYVQKGRSWCIALASDAAELGYATLGVKVSANGTVNVSGYMGDGVKVSASAKAEIGQGWLAVPVAVYKKSGKTVKTFGCRVSLDEASGKVGIANATPYAGSGFVLAASGLPELKKKEMKAASLMVSAGDVLASRPDAVKLTYNEKSGAIGGTATWFEAGGKKKLAGKVYGVVIGRQGFGEVVVKNIGTFRFTLVLAE